MKLLKNKTTGQFRILGIHGVTTYFSSIPEARKDYKRLKRNANRRATNELLRDLTGIPASQARIDMGLNSGGY